MDSIFAKAILFLASILAFISGPDYIKLGADDLVFDFKTGGNFPIYHYLNIQNIGPTFERFEISSDADWISGRREGTNYDFVELGPRAYINFILEINPVRLPDGVNEAEVTLKVFDIESFISQEVVLDEAKVLVKVNKNIVLTPSPTVSVVSSSEPSPEPSETRLPSADLNPFLKQIQSLVDSLKLLIEKLLQ